MQLPFPAGKPSVGVLFDGDIGNRPDTMLALALLYGLDGKNECRAVVVTTSKPNLKSAAACDAIAKFYAAGGFSRTLAVGMPETGPGGEDTPMLDAVAKLPHSIKQMNDTAIVSAVMRNALTAQFDGNMIVIVAGPATNAASLLELNGAREWIEKKARILVVSDHMKGDIPAAKKLFMQWPGPIVFAGAGVSAGVLFPASSIEKDFAWSDKHPVAEAYKAFHSMPYDSPTLDMAAVLYAVRPQEGYFKLSEPGTLAIADDGSVNLMPSAEGKHKMLLPDPAQKDRIVKTYTEVASAKPVPRARFRPPVADEKKPPPSTVEPKKP